MTETRLPATKTLARALAPISILAAGLAAGIACADDGPLAGFLAGGAPILDLRYRYEYVDEGNPARPEKAHANTLRARLGFMTAERHRLQALLEFEGSMHLGSARFDDTLNGRARRPVVADPENTALNRAWLNLAATPDTDIRVGRHRIKFDNTRFVGNVGWRQNEQTYDGVRLIDRSLPGLTVNYAWISRVKRIFGDDSPNGEFDTAAHLINLRYDGFAGAAATGYGYLIDIDENAALSSKTFGVLVTGSAALADGVRLLYSAEAARQTPYGGNPGDFDLGFLLVEPGLSFDGAGVTLKAAMEYLEGGGSAAAAFRTPLATLHARQGWADRFLTTPPDGVRDLYATVAWKARGPGVLDGAVFTAVWRDFEAARGGAHYGSEIDLLVSLPLGDGLSASLKGARYIADEYAFDVTKFWATLEFSW